GADAKNPGIRAEEDFIKGLVEVQDEGSQLAALFSAAKPGEQVIDLCSRAGVHNAEVRTPKGEGETLSDIKASADLVLIDAPCTGTGTWRRNPDGKWRMRPGALEIRIKDQIEVLDRASSMVKLGGRIAYITC